MSQNLQCMEDSFTLVWQTQQYLVGPSPMAASACPSPTACPACLLWCRASMGSMGSTVQHR